MSVYASSVVLRCTSVIQTTRNARKLTESCYSEAAPPQEKPNLLGEARYNCLGTRDKRTIFHFGV